MSNTLAYHGTELITTVKSFMMPTPACFIKDQFCLTNKFYKTGQGILTDGEGSVLLTSSLMVHLHL
jgi:hypothetical protein